MSYQFFVFAKSGSNLGCYSVLDLMEKSFPNNCTPTSFTASPVGKYRFEADTPINVDEVRTFVDKLCRLWLLASYIGHIVTTDQNEKFYAGCYKVRWNPLNIFIGWWINRQIAKRLPEAKVDFIYNDRHISIFVSAIDGDTQHFREVVAEIMKNQKGSALVEEYPEEELG